MSAQAWLARAGGSDGAAVVPAPTRLPLEFHRRIEGYRRTPLHDLPALADRLGVARVWVKDETDRLGLSAFKVLGAAWAIARTLTERAGAGDLGAADVETLRRLAGPALTFVTASDGNHGRAVARIAALLGARSTIVLPTGVSRGAAEAIRGEGATVLTVDGGYDDAVRRAAALAGPDVLVISDADAPPGSRTPEWVIEGYSTLFWEIEDELERREQPAPSVVVVQMGVGALAAAAVCHYRTLHGREQTIVGVEPPSAACVRASLRHGRLSTLTQPQHSAMVGLNCGTPSPVAWPILRRGLDVSLLAPEERVPKALALLAANGIVAGETGAAGLAALLALRDDEGDGSPWAGPGPDDRVLLLCTEGPPPSIA